MVNKFRPGDSVKLKAFEDQPEEQGEVRGYSGGGTYVVVVDRKHREPGDDGLREVPTNQMEKI